MSAKCCKIFPTQCHVNKHSDRVGKRWQIRRGDRVRLPADVTVPRPSSRHCPSDTWTGWTSFQRREMCRHRRSLPTTSSWEWSRVQSECVKTTLVTRQYIAHCKMLHDKQNYKILILVGSWHLIWVSLQAKTSVIQRSKSKYTKNYYGPLPLSSDTHTNVAISCHKNITWMHLKLTMQHDHLILQVGCPPDTNSTLH